MRNLPIPKKDDPVLEENGISFTELGKVNGGAIVKLKKRRWYVPFRHYEGESVIKDWLIKVSIILGGEVDADGHVHVGKLKYLFYSLGILGLILLLFRAYGPAVQNWTVFGDLIVSGVFGFLLSIVILEMKKGVIIEIHTPKSNVIVATDESKEDPEQRALVEENNRDEINTYVMPRVKFEMMSHFGGIESKSGKSTPTRVVDRLKGNATWTHPIPEYTNASIIRQFPGDNQIATDFQYTLDQIIKEQKKHHLTREWEWDLHERMRVIHKAINWAYEHLDEVIDDFNLKPYKFNLRNRTEEAFLYFSDRYTREQVLRMKEKATSFNTNYDEFMHGFNKAKVAEFILMDASHRETMNLTKGIQMGLGASKAIMGGDPTKIAQVPLATSLKFDELLAHAQDLEERAKLEEKRKMLRESNYAQNSE